MSGPNDIDITQGRQVAEPDVMPKQQPWQPKELNEDQMRKNLQVVPVQYRPEVILRLSEQKTLLLSGLLDKGRGQCSAVRKQSRLPWRDYRKLRPGLQCDSQLRPSPSARCRACTGSACRQTCSSREVVVWEHVLANLEARIGVPVLASIIAPRRCRKAGGADTSSSCSN